MRRNKFTPVRAGFSRERAARNETIGRRIVADRENTIRWRAQLAIQRQIRRADIIRRAPRAQRPRIISQECNRVVMRLGCVTPDD